ncbi:MAG TPA: efflux RND transporter periplasmic adaptor subunit [Polyangia bacterium]|jgi:membrane fusion protein (multidrug efflux system)
MKSKTRVWIVAVIGLVIVVAVLAGIKVGQIKAMIAAGKAYAPPPESVTTVKVASASWQGQRAAIGSLVAVHDVVLGAEAPGLVQMVAFDSGKNVKRGAVLVKIDTSNEEAQLASAKADAALARSTLERATVLRKGGANTQADLEAAEARAKQTTAIVANLEATISKKTIRAPFDGRVAIRQVERGQVVSPGTPVATLQSVDPIYAEFSLPQQALADLKIGQNVTVTVDSFPGAVWQGEISTVNSEVDSATRNIRIRATLPNKDGRLRPGLFVNVQVHAEQKSNVLTVPATSVIYAPYGDSVFVVEPGKGGASTPPTVEPRFVRLGEQRGDLVAVVSGLKAGETVVSNGAFKLRKGMQVLVNNPLAPPVELDPKPPEQ